VCIRARESNEHVDERAAAAWRRRVPTPIKEERPLRVAETVVYTCYSPFAGGFAGAYLVAPADR